MAPPARSAALPMPSAPPAGRPLRLLDNSGDPTGPIGYAVLEPDDADESTPLVIALHGMGDTAEGFARFLRRLGLRARFFVARGPLPFGNFGGRQWYEMNADDAMKQIHNRAKDLLTLADKVRALHPQAGKPLLLGFSQGASIALQAALEFPDSWRGVVGLSGYIATEGGAVAPTSPMPVLVVAGTKDDIVPEARSWAAAGALERAGNKDVRRFEFDGPHEIPKKVIEQVQAFFVDVVGPGVR
ncbi:MAG: alpha/beta hydrolase [Myxococcota bacterium]